MPGTWAGERAVEALLRGAHLAAPHQLAGLLARHAAALGVNDAMAYLADLQQTVLVPFLGSADPAMSQQVDALSIDSTLAGRSFQHIEVLTQDAADGGTRVWLPLLNGAERLGVLAVTVPEAALLEKDGGPLGTQLRRFASLAAELIMTKTMYGDTIVRLRRRAEMGLAAEMQWSLLPPLAFACEQVTVAGALEPAYEVAGDSVDYAVDAGYARFAVFDGMGHGLRSAQLATLTVAAYRNARRAGKSLTDTAHSIDTAVGAAFRGEAFTTAVIAELDTDTGMLRWVNAGHPEPLLLREGRLVKSLRTDPILPFGLVEDIGGADVPVVVGSEQLEPGDRVLLYTDGVTEARSPQGDYFGVERLTDLLARNLAGGLPTPETLRRVVRSLLQHHESQLEDDATMLLAEWCSGNEQALLP
jgi:Stage II sporulation protein E (SpoIIE)